MTVDLIPSTTTELILRSAARHGERTALICDDERLSYQELVERIRSLAGALENLGVRPGDHVGLLMENRPEWIALYFAVTGIGAVFVPLSTFSREDDLAYYLNHADLTHLITVDAFLGRNYLSALTNLIPSQATTSGVLNSTEFPLLRKVVVFGDSIPDAFVDWSEFDQVERESKFLNSVRPEDECLILYTSGTTSKPKGAVHSHRAISENGTRIGDYQGLEPDDVVWFYFPLFFSAGCINVALGTLSHGAALILQPVFDPGKALELIEREGATTWHLWPHTFKELIAHPDWAKKDHSKLHKGTGPYDVALGKSPDGLGGVNMYGLTETCTAFTCTEAYESAQIRLQTQGKPLPGNELKIVDPETGAKLPRGAEGEIRVKGPAVLKRYYKVDPAEIFDDEGFFITGDLGFLDEEGRLHFVRRLKDVIKTGGINVSPSEVEAFLLTLPGVIEAHVVGIPSSDRGEVVAAAIVGQDALDVDSIWKACEEKLPRHKRPVVLKVVEPAELPMTGSGKVQKFVLREMLLKQSVGVAGN